MEPGADVVLDPLAPNVTSSGLSSVNSRLFAFAAELHKRGHVISIASPEDLEQASIRISTHIAEPCCMSFRELMFAKAALRIHASACHSQAFVFPSL